MAEQTPLKRIARGFDSHLSLQIMFNKKRKEKFKDLLKNGNPPPPPEMQWREVWWDWYAVEGGYRPIFGRSITNRCFTLYFGLFAVRFRYGGGLPKQISCRYHPIYFEKCDLD